jgi:hypothetical protein
VEVKSNLSQNTQELLAEAEYQAALSALNESFLTKPPQKIVSRPAMHHKIKWDGKEGTFLLFKNQYEAHLMSSQQDYAADPTFRKAYIEQNTDFGKVCMKYGISPVQVASDTKQQYGALSMACSTNQDGQRFLVMYPRDGIRVWDEMVRWFQYGGTVENVLNTIETALQKEFTNKYPGGIMAYINMIANTYARQKQVVEDNPNSNTTLPTDVMKMRHVRAKLKGTDYALAIHHDFQECIKTKSTFDTFLSKIRATFEYIEDGDLHVAKCRAHVVQHETTTSNQDEVRNAVTLISKTDPMYLDDTLMGIIRKLDPDFARKFIQARDQYVRNLAVKRDENGTRERTTTHETAGSLPKQYSNSAVQANVAAKTETATVGDSEDSDDGSDAAGDDDSLASLVKDHLALLLKLQQAATVNDQDSLRRGFKTFTIRTDFKHAIRAALAIGTNGWHSTVSDGGADTWILGTGWRTLAKTGRTANVIGFDSNYARKRNLPIVVSCAVTRDQDGKDVLLVVFDGVANPDSPISLLGEFQTREVGNIVDSVSSKHQHWDGTAGKQGMKLRCPLEGSSMEEAVIPFQVHQALMMFPHREPTDDELLTLPRFLMTPRQAWMPPDHHDTNQDITPCFTPDHAVYRAVTSILASSSSDIYPTHHDGGGHRHRHRHR